jgi:hypothetical protein
MGFVLTVVKAFDQIVSYLDDKSCQFIYAVILKAPVTSKEKVLNVRFKRGQLFEFLRRR